MVGRDVRAGRHRQHGESLADVSVRSPDARDAVPRLAAFRKQPLVLTLLLFVGRIGELVKTIRWDEAATRGELASVRAEIGTREALTEARARADAAEARSAELFVDLAAERAKTEKAIAEFAALVDRLTALAEERAKAAKAIAAFAALAERLDALAEERPRPWWKRLMGWQSSPGPHIAAKRTATPA
jgi:hypothetical protein